MFPVGLLILWSAVGCVPVPVPDPDPVDEGGLAIAGSYAGEFGGTWTITESELIFSYGDSTVLEIVAYDNDERFIVAQNGSKDPYNPDLFSRFDWIVDGDGVLICQQVFDAETQTDAENATPADSSDPENGGCGDKSFAFTRLTPG